MPPWVAFATRRLAITDGLASLRVNAGLRATLAAVRFTALVAVAAEAPSTAAVRLTLLAIFALKR